MDNDDNNDNTELLMIVNNNNSSHHENINNKNPTAKITLMINEDYFQIQLIQLTKNYLSIHLISGKIS